MLIKVNNYFIKYKIKNCDQADKFLFYICQKICFSLTVMYLVPYGLHLFYRDKCNELVRIECLNGFSSLVSANNISHKTKIIIQKKPFIDMIYQSLDYFQQ